MFQTLLSTNNYFFDAKFITARYNFKAKTRKNMKSHTTDSILAKSDPVTKRNIVYLIISHSS